MSNKYFLLFFLGVFTCTFNNLIIAQCVSGTPPLLNCGTSVTPSVGSQGGVHQGSIGSPSCSSGGQISEGDFYQVIYQPGLVVKIESSSFNEQWLEILSLDGCTSHGCEETEVSGGGISGGITVTSGTFTDGGTSLSPSISFDGYGFTPGETLLVQYAIKANCGGGCSSPVPSAATPYTINCGINLADNCSNDVGMSGNVTYTLDGTFASDGDNNSEACGWSIENNLMLKFCTDADVSTDNMDIEVNSLDPAPPTGYVQFAILEGPCGGPYTTVRCESSITTDVNYDLSADLAPNTCYWFSVDGWVGTMYNLDVTIHDIAPLPIAFIPLEAERFENGVELSWGTTFEQNNASFRIERSVNGLDFYEIEKVLSTGDSETSRHYTKYDTYPPDGELYYRIKQYDLNGEYSLSNMAVVNYASTEVTALATAQYDADNNAIQYSLFSRANEATITLTDMTGRKLKEKTLNMGAGFSEHSLDASGLNYGNYFLILTSAGERRVKKVIIL